MLLHVTAQAEYIQQTVCLTLKSFPVQDNNTLNLTRISTDMKSEINWTWFMSTNDTDKPNQSNKSKTCSAGATLKKKPEVKL